MSKIPPLRFFPKCFWILTGRLTEPSFTTYVRLLLLHVSWRIRF
nr:MAG TPA: hypothetical protein [Caudoviricetes sp.]DAW78054.1 MAG TPA: hypothetical protein [Caudoviricetes sp.]